MINQVGEWKKSAGIDTPSGSKRIKAEGKAMRAEGREMSTWKKRAES